MLDRNKVFGLFEQQAGKTETRVREGIEKNRKGDAVVRVRGTDGAPITNARVSIEQKTHAFRFGVNLFMLDELESDEKNEKYKRIVADTFNMATLPFYWDATEPVRGQTRYAKDSTPLYRRPTIDRCMEFCERNGIEPREHGLAYEAFFPKWLYGADTATVKRELERRYREIATRYADRIRTIEVTNEMEWTQGKTAFYDASDYVEWCFRLAEQYFPQNQLVINEHTRAAWEDCCRATDKYYAYTEAAMAKGVRIDAIGMQYHMFHLFENNYQRAENLCNPERLFAHMDLYAELGKPLQITEVTVPAYSDKAEDEAIQAELLRNLYRIWFSHPAVEQIVYWNLIDGYAHLWDPSPEKIRASQGDMTLGENVYYGGLLRFDLSAKPAFYALKDLIEREWHTAAQIATDSSGTAGFRGFYGTYEITVAYGEKTITRTVELKKNAKNVFEFDI